MDGDFRFAEWLVCPKLNTVQGHHSPVRIEPKLMQVLVCLAARPGDVVSKEELMAAVWPDTFVTDDVLTRAVSELRRVFGDDAKRPRIIETIARGGYRLIVRVEPVIVAIPAERRIPMRYFWASGAGLLLLLGAIAMFMLHGRTADASRERSIAVLPMENLSHDPQQDYFADAMTDELINELAQLKALRVVSRTSVMQFRGSNKPLAEIANALHVDTVVEGSVLRSGDRVRITAGLVDAKTDKQIWAKKYDRDLHDVLTLQGDVAAAIADEIRVKVTPQEQVQLARARPVDPAAYDLYLQGFNFLWNQGPFENGPTKGLKFFEQAIAKDSSLTMAYVGIADAHILLVDNGFEEPVSGYAKVSEAANQALKLDSNSGEVHRVLGAVREYERDWAGSKTEYELATKLQPGSPRVHHWYALRLANMGLADQSIAEARRAVEIDPAGNFYRVILAETYSTARRYENAITELHNVLDTEPHDFSAHSELANVLLLAGRSAEAMASIEEAREDTPDKESMDVYLGRAYALAGKRDQALGVLQKMKKDSGSRFVRPTEFAQVYCALGDKGQTFEWLETAFRQRDTALEGLKVDPEWDALRSDPHYQDLLKRLGL
jgi:TolB-like protein/DNA-binding winged helix-turn-helix (wHTH) protein/Tfp pilus assembly protein PilF